MNHLTALRTAVVVASAMLTACEKPQTMTREDFAVPVRAEKAVASDFAPSVVLYGSVQPALTIPLAAQDGGTVEYPARFASGLRGGVAVRAGEPLAYVYNEDARFELERARLDLERYESALRRSRTGFEQGVTEKAQLEADEAGARIAKATLESVERRTKRQTISAPRDGVLVIDRVVAPQSAVAAGEAVGSLAADGRARIEAVAAAADLSRIRPGQPATFRRRAGDPEVRGQVIEVGSTIDAGGTIRVVAEAESREGLPAPGEGVEVSVELQTLPGVVTVPEQAIVISGGAESVFVVDGTEGSTGRARNAPVSTGGRAGGRVAILSGVTTGDLVVVRGADLISDGVLVTVVKDDEAR